MDGKTELDLVDMPFIDVIEFIGEIHKINIRLDRKVLKEVPIDTSQIVNFQFSGIKLRSALKIILEQLTEPLTYIIEDEVMKITTLEEAASQLSIQVYPVGDLLEGVEGKLVHPKYGRVVPVNNGGGGG
ncbi:MAG: hypothetical protein IH899_07050, partial [Planctomycetes bacterium]|nr:hypothetical protein [Planctomycetota bacterium]